MKTINVLKLTKLLLVLSLFFISSCSKDNDGMDGLGETGENELVNNWIYSNMIENYYWYKEIPNQEVPTDTYPEDYFYSLVYDTEDKWSYITDDFLGLMSELTGTPKATGYSPTFGLLDNLFNVFMVVQYVYPDSPAGLAGVKRGDIIMEINGEKLNVLNYYDLYSEETQTLKYGYVADGTIYEDEKEISLVAERLDVNPALYDTTFTINGVNVGYVVITEFVETERFTEYVGASLADFKSTGVTELIVDLRYNPGGYITSAQWLASAIAPSSVVNSGQVLTKLEYNDKFEAKYTEDQKQYKFIENDINFNLNKVTFLTTSSSASASELTIIGLDPYMEVTQIGDSTYGKYTGSVVIPDLNFPPQHNWAMMPIVLKYANALGVTDFVDGLYPDYYVFDDIVSGIPFGDQNDPLLAKALELITGNVVAKSQNAIKPGFTYKMLKHPKQMRKSNLFIQ